MRLDLQRLINTVEGRTVFILGGGASVTPEIIASLNQSRAKTFCLNSSAKFINAPIAVMWCDDSWAATNLRYLDTLTCPKFYVKTNGGTHINGGYKGLSSSTVLNKTGDFGFDTVIDNVRGNNSGANAINLLVNCRVAKIALVGFDMAVSRNNKAHFHSDYTYSIRPSVYSDLFIPSINSMADALSANGSKTQIFNCNKFSSLKCFEYKDIKEMI